VPGRLLTRAERQPFRENKEQARVLTKGDRRMITFAARSREWFTQLERTHGSGFMKVLMTENGVPHVDSWNRGCGSSLRGVRREETGSGSERRGCERRDKGNGVNVFVQVGYVS
jgi:hypothetical protein